jgi:hypothetical protein
MSNANQRLQTIFNDLDNLFEGYFEWLEGQYDPKSGGFFYAQSSKSSGKFIPDIESTSQAINILERCEFLPKWDPAFKTKATQFYQGKQDPATGYFYDEDPNMRLDEVMVGRAIAYSVNSLRKLGAQPLYPLPSQQHAAPAYMKSPQAYAEWLRSISLANSWRGCDRLCNSAPYIGQLEGAEQEAFLKEAFSYFDSIQDKESGLWGEGSRYVQISGSFKLHTFYNRFQVKLPRAAELYQSLLYTLRNDEAKDMCYIRNPIDLLSEMTVTITDDEMAEIAETTVRNMKRLKRADGGFSRELDHSPVAPNVAQVKKGEYYPEMPIAVPLGLGLVEGDMNAGTQAIWIRVLLHELAGFKQPQLKVPAKLFDCYRAEL